MSTATSPSSLPQTRDPTMDSPSGSRISSSKPSRAGILIFVVILLAGIGYIATKLTTDLAVVHTASIYPFVLLGLALLIALGFEFVNRFHDTANAVATVTNIRNEAASYGSLAGVPPEMQANVRNQMYLVSETLRLEPNFVPKLSTGDAAIVKNYKGFLDNSTKFIPTWVKVAVALALGLGTMVG